MRRTLELGLVALLATASGRARAWCQSLSVTSAASPRCDAPCLTLDDFTDAEIEEQGVVPLAWRQPCVEWTLHPRGTDDMPRADVEAAIARSFEVWTGASCGADPVGFVVTRRDPPDLLCEYIDHAPGGPNANVIVFADDWSARFNPPRAFALTSTWFDPGTGEILGVDLELNDERRTWTVCPAAGCDDGRVDLENVLVHELGHWFGLAHSPESEAATMWACSDVGETLKRDLEDDDRAGWCALYEAGLGASCREEGDAPRVCRFLGDECDPMRPAATCESGYCEDLGAGPECTIPCDEDPAVCPGGFACVDAEGGSRCAATGCGCHAAPASPSPAWALALAVAAALRRRACSRRRRP